MMVLYNKCYKDKGVLFIGTPSPLQKYAVLYRFIPHPSVVNVKFRIVCVLRLTG